MSLAPKGSSFWALGARGFEFLGPGYQRVRVFWILNVRGFEFWLAYALGFEF